VVVGLETLASFADLAGVAHAVGGARVIFSLDLRRGRPIVRADAPHARMPRAAPLALVEAAGDAGARSVIVLDLARVGTGRGLDLTLIRRVRRGAPGLELIAGGGVRDRDDLERLRDAGCDAALVATALHDGHVTAADVAAVRDPG
jgi:phosphoribosylformimino-5-aminoimidazole carboxamide ribotide isomerase